GVRAGGEKARRADGPSRHWPGVWRRLCRADGNHCRLNTGQPGEAIGVIPEGLMQREIGHRGVTKLHVVATMHERKALMADLSDAFIALPGGYGTLEEFAEIVTWSQLGIQVKPCALLNTEGYWDGLLKFLDHAVGEDFVRAENRGLIVVGATPEEVLDKII